MKRKYKDNTHCADRKFTVHSTSLVILRVWASACWFPDVVTDENRRLLLMLKRLSLHANDCPCCAQYVCKRINMGSASGKIACKRS
jgi:hypothetical protein